MANVKIKVDPQETKGVKLNTTATAMSITAIGDISDGGESEKKELVITFTEYDDNGPVAATVSSNYADIVDEDIDNVSVKIISHGNEAQCTLYDKYYDSEYRETSLFFISPYLFGSYQYTFTVSDNRQNVALSVNRPDNYATPNLTIES